MTHQVSCKVDEMMHSLNAKVGPSDRVGLPTTFWALGRVALGVGGSNLSSKEITSPAA